MAEISKSALKAKLLEHLRSVEETGEELVVTDQGKPVLRIVPIKQRRTAAEIFADVRGRYVEYEDVMTPTTDEWPET
jgi:prevent-host-death family protein